MKKNEHGRIPVDRDWRKIGRVMKLTTIIYFVCLMQVSATVYSQSTKFTFHVENMKVVDVLKRIEDSSKFRFFYQNEQVDVNRSVSIKVNDATVEQILDEMFAGKDIGYKVMRDFLILLSPKDLQAGPLGADAVRAFQQKSVSGKVTDSDGQPLPGVTVVVQGTTQGTVTNADGEYSLANIPDNAAMVFSFVGMRTREILVAGKTNINVIMVEESIGLEEVVAIGYGVQKKANLTGSVSSVGITAIESRAATTSAANILQGRVAGLRVTQPGGQPGRDDGAMEIRGMGSFGASSSPLVLVDGVTGSITNLSPNDIENITVLKDAASASIYGARAANGVILVTTKKAKTKGFVIEYKLDMGSQSATRLPDLIYNSAEYMEMYNTAYERVGLTPLYTQDMIDAYANANNDPEYPNFNWMDYYFHSAPTINNYLSISNVTDKTSYKFSLNYLNTDGIVTNNINYKRYNAQLNFDSQLNKAIKIGTNIGMVFKDNHEPPGWEESSILAVIRLAPNFSPFLPDGSGRKAGMAYPNEPHYAAGPYFDNGARYTKNYGLNAQAYADVEIFKGLVWSSKFAVDYSDNTVKDWGYNTQEHYYFHKLPGETDYTISLGDDGPTKTGVTDNYWKSITPTIYSTLAYNTTIASNHNINALLGYEQQSGKTQILQGSKNVFPITYLKELDAGGTSGQTTAGTAYEWALRSYFCRLSYNYKGKYLLEANARYDGTSRVSEDNRWGVFPSVSGGWRISEESFIKNISWIDNLKLRGSWGILGNSEIGNYPYQSIYSLSQYAFGSSPTVGVRSTRLTDKNLSWESTKVINFGMDVDLFKNLFGLTFDVFKKNTYDILATLPVPNSLGLKGPVTNDGELQNTGWELELRHANKVDDFSYNANFIISAFKNELLSIVTPTKGIREVGLPYNSFYLYEMIGIFQSQEEIDNSPTQTLYPPFPGSIKLKDQDGNGVVDADDRVSYSPFPDFTYSFFFNAGWKGFNLSVFLQGVEGMNTRISSWGWDPFNQGDPPSTRFRDAWTPTNPSNTIPAIYYGGNNGGAGQSTYDLQDASYMRIKSVKLSYTLPQSVTDRIKSKGITVYISGDNLFTFTDYPGMDPERRSTGPDAQRAFVYPQVRTLGAGIDVKF
ncbi:SusC/RagA family TonB-linked outer membrane protein [Mariniphaga sediminis]|jgi:TonB-linked SusC/RagA family outer membrane protein|uniref:SusC/RagA family TonB-linked outer membrane protein n=1 Tax=Mariniphaga sediminis TaxID=1628158 RepID=A0A399CZS1_9BACT|nr:TonB-dependent receptor [Mariniphaga sediminis]RIH63992.1 SusC/RagA family TonB-linked outer membrane protein [Mariniphaga sediminis]